MNALRGARGTAATPPRDQRCSCDGGGWIVKLDRDRYKAPGTAEMVRFTRCICLDDAPGPARSGQVLATLSVSGARERNRRLGPVPGAPGHGSEVAPDDVQFVV